MKTPVAFGLVTALVVALNIALTCFGVWVVWLLVQAIIKYLGSH